MTEATHAKSMYRQMPVLPGTAVHFRTDDPALLAILGGVGPHSATIARSSEDFSSADIEVETPHSFRIVVYGSTMLRPNNAGEHVVAAGESGWHYPEREAG